MSFGLLDSALTRRGYVYTDFDEIWGERRTLEAWFEVEATLAEVQATLGIIPKEAARAIRANARVSDQFVDAVSQGGVGNPLIVGLDNIRKTIPPEHRGWVHYGATSQDILDTARALQIRESLDLMESHLIALRDTCERLAHEHAETVMVARTNGQQALPTTLGLRISRWKASLDRDLRRLQLCRDEALSVQFSGAAGTYASNGEDGPRIAEGLADQLDLTFRLLPWHADRDSITMLCCVVTILGQNLAKIAEDLFDMQRNEIGEAFEAMDAHLSGSSAMPQKRNPFAMMKTSVAARLAAGATATLLTQPPGAHERDHRQLEVERDVLPRTLVLVGGALEKLNGLFTRLTFNAAHLRRNAELDGPLILTENILMQMAPHIGHDRAHHVLQDFAAEYREKGTTLAAFVSRSPELSDALASVDLDRLSQPDSYTGLSAHLARQGEQD